MAIRNWRSGQDMHLLDGRRLIVAPDIPDEYPAGDLIDACAKRVSQSIGPDFIFVRAGPVVEGIVRRDRAVAVYARVLPRVLSRRWESADN